MPAFALLFMAYAAASYLLFALPDSRLLLAAANVLFPLWNTGYSITIEEECLVLVLLIALLAFFSEREFGYPRSGLKALQYASLSILPLGLMMLVSPSGYGFLFVRVMNFQAKYGFIPWFTNEDLLALSLALFAITSALRSIHRLVERPD